MPDTQSILDAKITYLPNMRRSDLFETIPLKNALRDIKKGAHKKLVEAAQFELLIGNDDGYKALKNKLPSYSFQGTFTGKVDNASFDTFSGLVGIDVDDLSPTELASAKVTFANDECCAYAFVSPSGSGIKAAIRVDDNAVWDDASFKVAFSRVERRLADKGITIDKSGKDVRRISFAAFDPQLFYRKHPKIFELDGVLLTGKPLVGELVEEDGYTPITAEDSLNATLPDITLENAAGYLPPAGDQSRAEWLHIGSALHHQFNGSAEALDIFDTWSQNVREYKDFFFVF